MTIGAWAVVAFIAIVGIACAAVLSFIAIDYDSKTWAILCPCLVVIATIAICGLFIWYRSNSASGQRALKDQQSNLSGGIERSVSVYDVNGNLIQEYHGKFDIETDKTSYILFDDEDGKRHIIYYTTGTIIVDEK